MYDLEKPCRACVKSCKNLINFDMKMTKNDDVFHCFTNLTQIQYVELTSKICKKCFKKLKEAFEFKILVLENNEKYLEMLEPETKFILIGIENEINKDPLMAVEFLDSLIEVKQEKIETNEIIKNVEILQMPIEQEPQISEKKVENKKITEKVAKNSKGLTQFECGFCDRVFRGVRGYKSRAAHQSKVSDFVS
jgi:hypothetical protein